MGSLRRLVRSLLGATPAHALIFTFQYMIPYRYQCITKHNDYDYYSSSSCRLQLLSIPSARDVMSCVPMEQELAAQQILTEPMHMLVHAMQLDATIGRQSLNLNAPGWCKMPPSDLRELGVGN